MIYDLYSYFARSVGSMYGYTRHTYAFSNQETVATSVVRYMQKLFTYFKASK